MERDESRILLVFGPTWVYLSRVEASKASVKLHISSHFPIRFLPSQPLVLSSPLVLICPTFLSQYYVGKVIV